jgi:hypothetical protein
MFDLLNVLKIVIIVVCVAFSSFGIDWNQSLSVITRFYIPWFIFDLICSTYTSTTSLSIVFTFVILNIHLSIYLKNLKYDSEVVNKSRNLEFKVIKGLIRAITELMVIILRFKKFCDFPLMFIHFSYLSLNIYHIYSLIFIELSFLPKLVLGIFALMSSSIEIIAVAVLSSYTNKMVGL